MFGRAEEEEHVHGCRGDVHLLCILIDRAQPCNARCLTEKRAYG